MTAIDMTSEATTHTATAKPHGFVTRGIHWLSAGLLAYGYFKGLDSINQLADPALFWFEIAFASALGLLFAFRLFWTHKVVGATRLPDAAPWWERAASKLVHYGLYASVFTVVGSGLGIAYAYATPWLGRWAEQLMIGLHEASLAVLPVLIMVHIAGALWHKLVRRDGVMESMTGRFSK